VIAAKPRLSMKAGLVIAMVRIRLSMRRGYYTSTGARRLHHVDPGDFGMLPILIDSIHEKQTKIGRRQVVARVGSGPDDAAARLQEPLTDRREVFRPLELS
jgi:hypothetical protein